MDPRPSTAKIFHQFAFINKWYTHNLRPLWVKMLERASKVVKKRATIERYAICYLLNELLNEGEKPPTTDDGNDKRIERVQKHLQQIIEQSKANYEHVNTGDLLTEYDIALKLAIKNEDCHDVFDPTPAIHTKKALTKYYTRAGTKLNKLIDKYHLQALQEMNATIERSEAGNDWYAKNQAANWNKEQVKEAIDKEVQRVVPNKQQYTEIKGKVKNVAEYVKKLQYNASDERIQQLIDGFITDHKIMFTDLSNQAREKLMPKMKEAINTIMDSINNPSAVVYVKTLGNEYADENKYATKKFTPEEFKNWMTNMFVNPKGGFIINYADDNHYKLTDGDNDYEPPAFIFEGLNIDIVGGEEGYHKDGGNFCKYYYTGANQEIRKHIRERYQIADHIPTKADVDLMTPCAIHSIILGVQNKKNKPITDRQRSILNDYLYTRIQTRYINASSLAIIAEEAGLQIEICDINGTPLHKYTAHGLKYNHYNPEARYNWKQYDKSHKKEGKLFGTKGSTLANERYYKYHVKLVLWEDHFFVDEDTPFGKRSHELIKELYDANELKPIKLLPQNIYSTRLPSYKVEQIAWGDMDSVFMTPAQVYDNKLHPFSSFSGAGCWGFDKAITDITYGNIAKRIDSVDEVLLPQLGYKLFLEELIKQNLNVYAVSSIPANFIRQSVKGAQFSISKDKIVGATTMLDTNSSHMYALANIDFPLDKPHICNDMSILQYPAFVIDAEVEYKPQHELDQALHGRYVLNNIDAKAVGMNVKHIYRGYYWKEVAKQPLKHFIEHLYSLRPSHPKMKKLLNSMYGKLIEKAPATLVKGTTFTDNVRNNPLIKEYEKRKDNIIYRYYNDTDFAYNFTIIASLLLGQQRENMRKLFLYCNDKSIPMYYSAADSIAIPTDCLPAMSSFIGPELGSFKIEAQSDEAVFVKRGLYYCGNQKIITSLPHVSKQNIEDYCKSLGITVAQMYKKIANGQSYVYVYNNGVKRCLSSH